MKQFRKKKGFEEELVRVLPAVLGYPFSLPSFLSSVLPPSFLLSPLRSATDAHADYSAAQCEERVKGKVGLWWCSGGMERGGVDEKKVLQKSVTVMSMS